MKDKFKLKTEDAIRSKNTDPLLRVMVNVELTFGWQSAIIDEHLKPFDLSRQQYNVMRIVRGQKGALISVNDIKSRMLDKMSNVTRLIDKLEANQCLVRIESEDDRRVRWVSITQKGLDLMAQVDAIIPNITAQFSTLSEDEINQLVVLLEKYRLGNPEK
jgi:DNA-binding MarR family transcriptional regulator